MFTWLITLNQRRVVKKGRGHKGLRFGYYPACIILMESLVEQKGQDQLIFAAVTVNIVLKLTFITPPNFKH